MGYIEGIITRLPNGEGDSPVELTATLELNGVTLTKTFSVLVREEGMSDSQIVAADRLDLYLPDKGPLTGDLILPIEGTNGSTITWSSDTPEFINEYGLVTRPDNGDEIPTVVLTASIEYGESEVTKDFTFTVKPWTDGEEAIVAAEELTFNTIKGYNPSEDEIVNNLILDTVGTRLTTITWEVDEPDVLDTSTGTITRPNFLDGDITITLTATISKGSAVEVKQFIGLTIVKLPKTNAEATFTALELLYPLEIIGTNIDLQNVISDLPLPMFSGSEETVKFTWEQVQESTPDPSPYMTIVPDGTDAYKASVTRPAITDENAIILLTVTATSKLLDGADSEEFKTFNVRILKEIV